MRAPTALALCLAACGANRPPAPATAPPLAPPAVLDAGLTDAAPAAPADPAREAVLAAWNHAASYNRGTARVAFGPTEFALAPGDRRVAALVVQDSTVTLVVTAVPYVARLAASEPVAVSDAAAASLSGLAVRDLNGDGRPDLVVFSAQEDVLADYVPTLCFAQMFALYQVEDEPRLAMMSRAQVELLGVRDEAALDAAIPTLGRYEPPAEGLSPARFIARLRHATPAALRAAVAPSGLRLCTDYPDRSGRRRLRCNTVPAARVENAAVAARVRAALGTFAEVQTPDVDALQPPACQRRGAETRCESSIAGPAGVHWSLIGEGASMRLIEVAPWGESE